MSADPHNPAGNNQPILAEEADRFRVTRVLFDKDPLSERLLIIILANRHAFLEDDGAAVKVLVHEMDRAPGHLHPVRNGLTLRMEAGEPREQGRVDVDDLVRERLHDCNTKNPHIAGEHE
jgi:hypothetical protein